MHELLWASHLIGPVFELAIQPPFRVIDFIAYVWRFNAFSSLVLFSLYALFSPHFHFFFDFLAFARVHSLTHQPNKLRPVGRAAAPCTPCPHELPASHPIQERGASVRERECVDRRSSGGQLDQGACS